MCVTAPMQIVSLDGRSACCEARGVRRDVRLDLLDEAIAIGDHVLIHAGYAIQTVTAADAEITWALFDEIASALDDAERAPHEFS